MPSIWLIERTGTDGEFTRLENWINVRVIQALVHHASAAIVALVLFWAVGFMVERLMHESPLKPYLRLFDQVVLIGLFAYLAYQLFTSL